MRPSEPPSKPRLLALGSAVLCTGLGWAGAVVGHGASSVAIRAALIFVVVGLGIAVFFISVALSMGPRSRSSDDVVYEWRTLPAWLALTLMATLFAFGPTWLGVGSGVLITLLGPVPDPKYMLMKAMMEERDPESVRYRPMTLSGEGEEVSKAKARDDTPA